ncbi:unnamed protein product [Owenia fusiformis]|uniref:Ig-like domain-containing protein n=1 Tax=Owenia fusiformis TaxID=6347 RepID=A0A8S4N190_OWEFU|nr:unnamed protein product [Owenia fusiformis]
MRGIICLVILAISGLDAITVTRAPANTGVLIGNNATLYCTVTNIGAGESVIWKKTPLVIGLDGSSTNTAKYAIIGQYNVVVMNAQIADEGQFECEAGGNQYSIMLSVGDVPTGLSIYWGANLNTPIMNAANNLTCQSTNSRPPATFKWYKGTTDVTSQALTLNGTVNSNGYGDSYSYLEVTPTSSNSGDVYRCEASVPGRDNALNETMTLSGGAADVAHSLTMMAAAILGSFVLSSYAH